MEAVDEHFLEQVRAITSIGAGFPVPTLTGSALLDLFDAQIQSRHLDFAARWLQSRSEGFYTIGSAGHEANAAVGLMTRPTDPALLHYRSGAFYAARAAIGHREADDGSDPVRDVVRSLVSSVADPMSGGRHKVFGHPRLHIVPQTSTIASHLPRAVGLGFAIGAYSDLVRSPWPSDSIVICSFGDASVNHSTAQGALNAAGYLAHRGIDLPVLFVCEDNGIGISTPTPSGWTERSLRGLPDIAYFSASHPSPCLLLGRVSEAIDFVRESRRPAVFHLRTVRFMGHAGSDVELGYRSRTEIVADYGRDPILATARELIESGTLSPVGVIDRYEAMRGRVMRAAQEEIDAERLSSREAVTAALTGAGPNIQVTASKTNRSEVWRGRPPEAQGPLTLAQTINAALTDAMAERPNTLVFGEDVAAKGGVYGITRGLRKRFGGHRVFDTLLDEQTVLGTALGTALAGMLPIPEIQYLAYLHNAEDQIRGEGASLQFFSNRQYRNPMVLRIAGLAYQRGFGGHFHNDNSVAVLRDIPGVVVCVPSHPADAPGLLDECLRLADEEGRVCVFLEPIALYHTRDLDVPGDGEWTATYEAADERRRIGLGSVGIRGGGSDLAIVTFGNGLPMSLRAARRLKALGIRATVVDLRWIAPLPTSALLEAVVGFPSVLVADETRISGGVGEAVLAALLDGGYSGRVARVASADSFIPLGPATEAVLLTESQIVDAAAALTTT